MLGKFIVLYGINNLGKSTQAKKLVERLTTEGNNAKYLKYPIYDLEPSGHVLNEYLRGGNPHNLSPREAQLIYILNRTQYEPTLKKMLEEGTHVVAEDYIGTGLSWGIGANVNELFLKRMNNHLLPEDLVFLFEGERFKDATEKNHQHETNDLLINKVANIHNRLGKEKQWIPINANQTIETIHEQLWHYVKEALNEK